MERGKSRVRQFDGDLIASTRRLLRWSSTKAIEVTSERSRIIQQDMEQAHHSGHVKPAIHVIAGAAEFSGDDARNRALTGRAQAD